MYNVKELTNFYNSLGIPSEYYKPSIKLLNSDIKFQVLLSERKTGKTTNILLLAMSIFLKENRPFVYCRDSKDHIKASNVSELFNVIINCGYIEKMTNGKYNNIYYHWKKIYLVKYDENNKILDKSSVMCHVLSCDQHETYKSTLNVPNLSLILYDEFITKNERVNAFFEFFDLHSTLVRNSIDVMTYFVANTISQNSRWYNDLLIPDVKYMKLGESRIFTTEKGTKVFVDMIKTQSTISAFKQKLLSLYYGFDNPKLNAITGADTWTYDFYNPIILDDNKTLIRKDIYISFYNAYLELMFYDLDGRVVCDVKEVSGIVEDSDSIVFLSSTEQITQNNHFKYFALETELGKYLLTLYESGTMYFSTPFVHDVFRSYLKDSKINVSELS